MDGAVVRRQLASVNSSLTWRINDCASWLLDPPHDYTPTLTCVPVHLLDLIPASPAADGVCCGDKRYRSADIPSARNPPGQAFVHLSKHFICDGLQRGFMSQGVFKQSNVGSCKLLVAHATTLFTTQRRVDVWLEKGKKLVTA